MGAGHDHGAVMGRAQASASARRRLWAALGILVVFTAVEAIAAALTGSLALVSDAGHMFTDVLALAMALAAVTAARHASGPQGHSFGLYRLEDDSVEYNLPYGEWIRLFRASGLVVEDLVEPRPAPDATSTYWEESERDWARRWPSEAIWKVRKP